MIREVRTVDELDQLFPQEPMKLVGFVFTPFPSDKSKLHAVDGAGEYIIVYDVPPSIVDMCTSRAGMEIYIRKFVSNYHMYLPAQTIYKYYSPRKRKCDCGAHVTFMPHQHSEWCSSRELI